MAEPGACPMPQRGPMHVRAHPIYGAPLALARHLALIYCTARAQQ